MQSLAAYGQELKFISWSMSVISTYCVVPSFWLGGRGLERVEHSNFL